MTPRRPARWRPPPSREGPRAGRSLHTVTARAAFSTPGAGPDRPGQAGQVEPGRGTEGDGRRAPGRRQARLGGALEHDAAPGEDGDAVGQFLGLAQLVGGEHDTDAFHAEAGHHGADGQASLGVHPGRGLVEEGHLGPADEGQCEREALLLAAERWRHTVAATVRQTDQVEQGWSIRRGSG